MPALVNVYPGDSRFYATRPDVYAYANNSTVDNVKVIHSPESIPMGINRILWWGGDWIEASTSENFTAMGVQFLGDPAIGWARVLFDGEEVWRGNTSAIWSAKGRFGGYVEISGFPPGAHTLRVESLNFDYHPVTVAGFGFSYEAGVTP